jgi:hypothetical protein
MANDERFDRTALRWPGVLISEKVGEISVGVPRLPPPRPPCAACIAIDHAASRRCQHPARKFGRADPQSCPRSGGPRHAGLGSRTGKEGEAVKSGVLRPPMRTCIGEAAQPKAGLDSRAREGCPAGSRDPAGNPGHYLQLECCNGR